MTGCIENYISELKTCRTINEQDQYRNNKLVVNEQNKVHKREHEPNSRRDGDIHCEHL